jgi:hypothetical protein
MNKPTSLFLAASVIGVLIAAVLFNRYLDWREAEHAWPQTMELRHVPAALCLSYNALRPKPSDGSCQLTGYFLWDDKKGCPGKDGMERAAGLSAEKHGAGQHAVFCPALIVSFTPIASR